MLSKKTNITRRISYSFGIVFLLYLIQTVVSVQALHALSRLAKTIYYHPLVVSNASLSADADIIKMHRNLKDLVFLSDRAGISATIARIDHLEQETFEHLDIIDRNILGQEGKQLVSETARIFKDWKPVRDKIIALMQNGERQRAAEITGNEGADYVAALEMKMIDLAAYARNKATVFLGETKAVHKRINILSGIFFLSWLALFTGIVLATIKKVQSSEKSLKEEKEKLNVTLRSIGDGVIATDRHGELTMINQVAENLTGWSEAEALGKNIREVFNIINETTRESCNNPVEKVLSSNTIIGLANHTVLIARDGTEKAVADSGSPITDQYGRVSGVVLVFRDQTEERQYQKRILESENKYRLLSDNTLDVIWTMNPAFEFTYVNPAIFSLTGYLPEEWIGSRLQSHCAQADFVTMAEIIACETAKGPESAGVIFATSIRHKNGESLPIEIHGKMIYDSSNRLIGLQGVVRDISERLSVEQKLRRSEALLNASERISLLGSWELDIDNEDIFWSREMYRIHDIAPETIRADEDLLVKSQQCYTEEDRAKFLPAFQQCLTKGEPYDLVLELVTAKGTHKWVRTKGVAETQNGKVVKIRGSYQDITARKIANNRIEHLNRVLRTIRSIHQLIIHEQDPERLIGEGCRLLVENRGYACALIVLIDESDKIISWDRAGTAANEEAFNRLLEQGKLPPCCNCEQTDRTGVIPVSRERTLCENCTTAEGKVATQSLCAKLSHEKMVFGYLVATRSNELNIDEEEQSFFNDLAADLAYALHVSRVNKAHKASAQKSESLERQLIQAQKMESVGRLAGGVAHDYNNMLSVIIGFTELAMDEIDPEDPPHKYLSEVLLAARRSSDITRQLLAFARKQTVAPTLLDLNRTVPGMLNMLHRLIGEDIDLVWSPGEALWPIKIDPAQVDQILANLCVNARDAIVGTGKLTIETENVGLSEDYCADHAGFVHGDYVLLAVSDDGTGMEQETLDNIFEPFYTTKEIGKGTGLGMSMIYGIVKQNKGFINIYSEPGNGTTVRIYFPRYTGAALEARAERDLEKQLGKGETILLVEDEEAILKLGKRVLVSLGYHVLDAVSPSAAVEIAANHTEKIDLLITDVVMPDMNGRELALAVKTSFPDIKVLYMSGYTANAIAHHGVLDAGVCFMQKPFSKTDMATKVRQALER